MGLTSGVFVAFFLKNAEDETADGVFLVASYDAQVKKWGDALHSSSTTCAILLGDKQFATKNCIRVRSHL